MHVHALTLEIYLFFPTNTPGVPARCLPCAGQCWGRRVDCDTSGPVLMGLTVQLIPQKTGPRLDRTGREESRRQGDPRAGVRPSLEGEIKEGFLEEGTFALSYKGKINTSHKEQG